ncbi:unnamed protein product, partial [Rotaria sordida]
MELIKYSNSQIDAYTNSLQVWCKLNNYSVFLLPCLSSTYITLASIDRFCSSSHREKLRKLSQVKVSRILIPSILLIWILFSSHVLILFDIMPITVTNPKGCGVPTNLYIFALIIDGYFFAIFNGIIVPLFLAIFGYLIYSNIQQNRRRVVPVRNANMNRT